MQARMLTTAEGDFSYQRIGEEYCRTHDDVALIWGYSTGKTRVALTRIVEDPRIDFTVYLTRKNNISPTAREIAKHSTVETVTAVGGTASVLKALAKISNSFRSRRTKCILLTNYESAKSCGLNIAALSPTAVIVDESTAVKRNSARTKAVKALAHLPSVIFRCVMSGEMAPQRKEDYYHQFGVAFGSRNPLGLNEWSFKNSYFTKLGYELILKPGARDRLLKVVAANSCILKTDDVRIPLRVEHRMLRVQLTAEQKTLIAMLDEGFVLWPDGTAWAPQNPAVSFEKRLQVCSGYIKKPDEPPWDGQVQQLAANPKVDALVSLLTDEMADHMDPGGPKVVVWARRNHEIDSICDALNKVHVTFVTLRGRNTAKTNDNAMIRMLHDPQVRVCVAQADMGFGVNELITCDTSIWFSNSFVVESRLQATMRLDRPGQRYKLLNHIDIVCEDGDDEAVAIAVGLAGIDCRGFTSKAQILQAVKKAGISPNNLK